MRYNLDSELPINAFSPRGGHSPFNHGMTLEGGGGGLVGAAIEAIGSVAKGATDVVKGIVQPVYNATLKNIPGVDKGLVQLDKSVGKAIPGGWGTVASVASSFIPGATLATMGMTQAGLSTGLGALSGSGVMRGDHKFNLQGAIMGGAMAYGASQLSAGLQEAGKATSDTTIKAIEETAKSGGESALTGTGSSVTPTANALSRLENIPTNAAGAPLPVEGAAGSAPNFGQNYTPTPSQAFTPSGDYGLKNLAPSASVPNAGYTGDFGLTGSTSIPSGLGTSAPAGVLDKLASGASDVGKGTLENLSTAGTGIKNLVGLGDASVSNAFTALKEPITSTGLAGLTMGGAGLAALEAQQKALDQQLAAGNIGQAEYNTAKAKIDAEIATANQAVASSPLKTSADTASISEGPSLYSKNTTGFNTLYDKKPTGGTTLYEQTPVRAASGGVINHYAMGGQVNPPDDQTGMPTQTPMQNFEHGGIMGYAIGGDISPYTVASLAPTVQQKIGMDPDYQAYFSKPAPIGNLASGGTGGFLPNIGSTAQLPSYAAGGGITSGRFLSGGGDGMSDSIQANIEGKQEARLADGEFVIPADVVSHIGNGSSKAGAKQLYSMMDRVRQARVGTKKQGKQINPRKYLAA